MLRKKLSALFAAALFFLLTSLSANSSFAQEGVFLYNTFPQQGELGAEVDMLINGEGFEMLPAMTAVLVNGQRVELLGYELLSDQFMRVHFAIPERMERIGGIEISFLFDDFMLGAYFVVTEPGELEFNPVIRQYSPREGLADSEMVLRFEGDRLSELGELGGLIIGNTVVPVIDHGLESDQALDVAIYLPDENPPGELEISVYFENYRFGDFFRVIRPQPEGPAPPELYALTPQEGFLDSEIELVLEGQGFLQLGDLLAVNNAGIDIPIRDQRTESDGVMVVVLYLPADMPAGETGIRFFFDNFEFDQSFFLKAAQPGPEEPRFPRVFALEPRQGQLDSDIDLFLEGENFFDLGGLLAVTVGGFELPVLYSDIESDTSMTIGVYLPEGAPTGEQMLLLDFDNTQFEEIFFITAPPENPIITILVGVLSAVGGFLAGRVTRPPQKGENGSNGDDEPDWRPPDVRFEIDFDPGIVSLEFDGPSLIKDPDLEFEVNADDGE